MNIKRCSDDISKCTQTYTHEHTQKIAFCRLKSSQVHRLNNVDFICLFNAAVFTLGITNDNYDDSDDDDDDDDDDGDDDDNMR